MPIGRSFQSLGARMEKALSPTVFNLDRGTTSMLRDDDLNERDGWYSFRSSDRYLGACPFKALYTNSKTLNSILALTGS